MSMVLRLGGLLLSVLLVGILFASAGSAAEVRHIAVLYAGSWTDDMKRAFRQGLKDAGYAEGRDISIDWRPAKGDLSRLSAMAADVIESKPEVIVVGDTPTARALKATGTTIPVVLTMVADPEGSGLVQSLAHPGGNITGLSIMVPDVSAKRMQLVKEAMPSIARAAVLWNPTVPYHPKVAEELKAAAPALSLELTFAAARNSREIDAAFRTVARAHAQVLYVVDDAMFSANADRILGLAAKARLPVIYASREYARKGALLFYGPSLEDQCRRAAGYVDRILKGSKPSEMPIERPTQFELVVNARAAKALGITLPESILLRADEVIR